MARRKVIATARVEGPGYLAKAQQFAAEAESALAAARYDAALLTAVHAAIGACDAVSVALAGRRSADPEHQRAIDLVEEVVGRGAAGHVRQARSLLAKKNVVEYEARRTTAREAREGVDRARRLVRWAEGVVGSARL